MQYRYRVIGKVKQSFILRGAYFGIRNTIDFYIMENELEFVKERCELDIIEDLKKSENSISNVAKSNCGKNPAKRQRNKRSEV